MNIEYNMEYDMRYDIETYLNSLPEDITKINVSNSNLEYIPSLLRFKNLEVLYCSNNRLTSLPPLNESLKQLICYNNNLTFLPRLNKNLIRLYCYNNKLKTLPKLNEKLDMINCHNNQLTSLPDLNDNLKKVIYDFNPIYKIINYPLEISSSFMILIVNKKIRSLNRFRDMYYSLKFKKKLYNGF